MLKVMDKADSKSLKNDYWSRYKIFILAVAMFVLGIAVFIAYRYITYKSDQVHYHANFALYVNGKRDDFKSFTFYEEVNSCSSDKKNNPKDRVHMHDQNNGLIHVHAAGVAWSHFFANLGYTLGDQVLKTDSGIYVDNVDGNMLTFVLNGQKVDAVADKLINSEDRLLINYGNENLQTILERSKTVPNDAHKANTENDPITCSGSVVVTPKVRLQKAIGY